MILRSILGLAFAMLLETFLPALTQAQNSEAKASSTAATCNYDVTSILNNTDNNNVAFQFQSDGLGSYTAYSNGKNDSLKSMIDKNCAWSLDTTTSKSRGIAVTLAFPYSSVSSSPKPPFAGTEVVKGQMNTHCPANKANNGVDVGAMTSAGQTLICPINVAFYYNSIWYNIGLNPYNWPGTTMAQVTCTGASGGHCNSWTILPDPATPVVNPTTGQLSSVGELTLPPCVGCGGGTAIAEYFFSYSFVITK
jgi:hypothetical protein